MADRETTPTHAVPECGQCPPFLLVPATNVNQLRLETIINANCGFICTQTKHTHTHLHTEVNTHAEKALPKFSDPLNFDQGAMGLWFFTVVHCQCCRWAAIKALAQTLTASGLSPGQSNLYTRTSAEAKARAKHRPGRSHAHYACATRCLFVVKWPLLACKVLATEAKPSAEPNGTDKERPQRRQKE